MPLVAWIEGAAGRRISATLFSGLEGILPRFDDLSYHCLRFITPYGDTVFDYHQMVRVLEALARLRRETA